MGGAGVGRGVARGGQHEVEGVGVAGHDHAVEGRGEREVADPCLDPLRLARGHGQIGLRDRDVDLGLRERGLLGEQLRLRLRDARLGRVPRGDARLPLVGRLEEDLGVDHALIDLVRQPLDLRVPAVDLGLILGQDRLGLGEPRLGRLDVGIGHLHHLVGQLDPFAYRASTVAFFVPKSSTSSGTKRVASTSPFFTLSPMSTIHLSM